MLRTSCCFSSVVLPTTLALLAVLSVSCATEATLYTRTSQHTGVLVGGDSTRVALDAPGGRIALRRSEVVLVDHPGGPAMAVGGIVAGLALAGGMAAATLGQVDPLLAGLASLPEAGIGLAIAIWGGTTRSSSLAAMADMSSPQLLATALDVGGPPPPQIQSVWVPGIGWVTGYVPPPAAVPPPVPGPPAPGPGDVGGFGL